MKATHLRYHPDHWAHDPGQWWAPLVRFAGEAPGAPRLWRQILGVNEFFDFRLLNEPEVFTPWICLAASAVAASTANLATRRAREAVRPGAVREAGALAGLAFELAVSLQRLRWAGERVGTQRTSSPELLVRGLDELIRHGYQVSERASGAAEGVALAAGWLALSGHAPSLAVASAELGAGLAGRPTAGAVVNHAAEIAARRQPDQAALIWGTAHLVERLARGTLDDLAVSARPDSSPAKAAVNVLLVSHRGELGLFTATRQRSALSPPAVFGVPDLARLAFLRSDPDFVGSVNDALTAADRATDGGLARPEAIISWSLQVQGEGHPLIGRSVSGRSGGLGAYVAFRSLSSPGVFAARNVAFTGQVSVNGDVGQVHGAPGKIEAATRNRISLVVHPDGLAWQDPSVSVDLQAVRTAEEALVAASEQLKHLSNYLQAACRLVAPEPWLQAWLERGGKTATAVPMLDVMCRQVASDRSEPTIPPGHAHLLARSHPTMSFAISGEAGAGSTVAVKRMVALAAREALDALRAGKPSEHRPFLLPLYVPLGERPVSWDDLVRTSVAALPDCEGPNLEVAAALASVLGGRAASGWQALIVADGTDRLRPTGLQPDRLQESDLVALLAGSASQGRQTWQPSRPPQVILCGRAGSPAHRQAAEALHRLRPGLFAAVSMEPLAEREIHRYIESLAPGSALLADWNSDLAANPLLLALSVIAGHQQGDCGGGTDLFHRGLDVLLADRKDERAVLAEIAFRAASSKGQPAGEFTLRDIAPASDLADVSDALAIGDTDRALVLALPRLDERQAFLSAERNTHLLTGSLTGWRFFHDRAFAFLVADRIARRAADGLTEGGSQEDEDQLFAVIGEHLGHPFWTDVVEATGRLLELHYASSLVSA
ncbi:MAG TPA: hypothetical protein VMR14_03010 [Streptosporangiaceae bacterium]|nr:hypothetical protein [Streptosporangiaceae bacterium]